MQLVTRVCVAAAVAVWLWTFDTAKPTSVFAQDSVDIITLHTAETHIDELIEGIQRHLPRGFSLRRPDDAGDLHVASWGTLNVDIITSRVGSGWSSGGGDQELMNTLLLLKLELTLVNTGFKTNWAKVESRGGSFVSGPHYSRRDEDVFANIPDLQVEVDPSVALAALKNDRSAYIRTKAAQALASVGATGDVMDGLVGAWTDPDFEVRQVSATTLGQLGWKPHNERELDTFLGASPSAESMLAVLRNNERRQQVLSAALSNANPAIRRNAVWVLGELRDRAGVVVVIPTLKDGDHVVRLYGVIALGKLGDARAVPAISDLVTTENDWQVRSECAHTLGSIGDAQATSALEQLASDPHPTVRSAAEQALRQLND